VAIHHDLPQVWRIVRKMGGVTPLMIEQPQLHPKISSFGWPLTPAPKMRQMPSRRS
jgi:hypothetical protein